MWGTWGYRGTERKVRTNTPFPVVPPRSRRRSFPLEVPLAVTAVVIPLPLKKPPSGCQARQQCKADRDSSFFVSAPGRSFVSLNSQAQARSTSCMHSLMADRGAMKSLCAASVDVTAAGSAAALCFADHSELEIEDPQAAPQCPICFDVIEPLDEVAVDGCEHRFCLKVSIFRVLYFDSIHGA